MVIVNVSSITACEVLPPGRRANAAGGGGAQEDGRVRAAGTSWWALANRSKSCGDDLP